MNAATEQAARAFLGRIAATFHVQKAFLYGSRARGDHKPWSDADVAVILAGAKGDRMDTMLPMSDIAYDVMMETGILITPLPIWDGEWTHPETFSNPILLENIKREGVRLC